MTDVSPTTSAFLRTIYNLSEDHIPVRRARIKERLHLSGPTVTQAVSRMLDAGLIEIRHEQYLSLTEQGLHAAIVGVRRHRLIELLLTGMLSLPAQHAHAEATRWASTISEETERAVFAALGGPVASPWGNPIPGLELIGGPVPDFIEPDLLYQLGPPGTTVDAVVRFVSEDAQDDPEIAAALVTAGIVPGAAVTVRVGDESYELRGLSRYDLPVKNAHMVRIDLAR